MNTINHSNKLSAADIERINALRDRQPVHDEDNPPLTAEQLKQLIPHRGRPRGSRKLRVTVRLDNDVVFWLKRTGNGYQTRLNLILRQAMNREGGRRISKRAKRADPKAFLEVLSRVKNRAIVSEGDRIPPQPRRQRK